MGLDQLNFEGKNKVDVAIMRMQEFEPPEGYYLAFSGGKDSITIYDLAVKAGVKFDAHYNMTGIDPPELVQFIRANYSQVEQHRPGKSIFASVQTRGLPRRNARWCCELLKEKGGHDRIVVTGVRWAESVKRRQRRLFEVCRIDGTKRYLNPILDWSTQEVWSYIKVNHIAYCSLYDEGFTRLGCILCPMAGQRETNIQIERWPKIATAWERAACRYFERGLQSSKPFKTGKELFDWWITRKGKREDAQCFMLDN
jgi:phosphoadenosine phosphosulfate reductase